MSTTERAALLPSPLALEDAALERIVAEKAKARSPRRRGWLVRRMLLLADVFGLCFAYLVAQALIGGPPESRIGGVGESLVFLLSLPAWVVIAKVYGLYDNDEERTDHSTVDETVSVFHLVTVGAWLLLAVTWLTGLAEPHLLRLVAFWALAILGISLARGTARSYCRRQAAYLQNAVVVGAGDVGQLVAHKLLQHREYGINLVGFVDAEPRARRESLEHLALLGPPEDLPEIVELFDVERVVIAFSSESHERTLDLIRSLKPLDVQIDIVPRLFEVVGPNVGIHTVEGLPLVGLPPLRLSRSSALLKRAMDIALAGLGLIALAPLFAVIAAAIKATSTGPVFFRQVRMGAAGEPFRILKFRTMVADAEERKRSLAHLNKHLRPGGDARMFKIADDPRITRLGAVLRRYCLDELPQLVNVLRGEMSLVGPRPLVLDEDQQVHDWGRERLNLKPGITGPWQVFGASDIPFEEMLKLDYLYVTGWSPFSDFKLVLRTVPAVLRPREAY